RRCAGCWGRRPRKRARRAGAGRGAGVTGNPELAMESVFDQRRYLIPFRSSLLPQIFTDTFGVGAGVGGGWGGAAGRGGRGGWGGVGRVEAGRSSSWPRAS